MGPMISNALFLDSGCWSVSKWASIWSSQERGPLGEPRVSHCSQPLSPAIGFSRLFREAREGCSQFSSWNSRRVWSVFHYRICTPIKVSFLAKFIYKQALPHSFPFNSKHPENCPVGSDFCVLPYPERGLR